MNHSVNLDPATSSDAKPTWGLVVVLLMMIAGEIVAEVLREIVVGHPVHEIDYDGCWSVCAGRIASVTRDGCWCTAPTEERP